VLGDLRDFQFVDAFATALIEDKMLAHNAHNAHTALAASRSATETASASATTSSSSKFSPQRCSSVCGVTHDSGH
jgi:hypothetical protein